MGVLSLINILKEYREKLRISTKREMADKIGVSEQFYVMVESGDRPASKDFIKKGFYLVVCLKNIGGIKLILKRFYAAI